MKLLVILLAWALVQQWGRAAPWVDDQLWQRWCGLWSSRWPQARWLAWPLLGLPLLLLAGLTLWFSSSLLLLFLLSVAVFLYSLGRGDLSQALVQYRAAWCHGNLESALHQATLAFPSLRGVVIDSPWQLHRRVLQQLLAQQMERWLAPLCALLLFGPVGALFYRLVHLGGPQGSAWPPLAWLEWPVARVQWLLLALIGHFHHTVTVAADSLWRWQPDPDQWIGRVGIQALDLPTQEPTAGQLIEQGCRELELVQALLSRMVVASLALAALWQLVIG